jgi:hypothetical protein
MNVPRGGKLGGDLVVPRLLVRAYGKIGPLRHLRQRMIAQSNVSSGASLLSNLWTDLVIAATLLGLMIHMI